MRTGADYKASLRDGRKMWVMNDGPVEDVVTHPATSGMVQEYVTWYDRHADPATLAAWARSHWEIENRLHWVSSPGAALAVASCGAGATRVAFSC